ncbi:cupin domain-containing protein [Saccharophagus degradans]|uniref:cupin domain-containing protein n=1 Tax=Saccharophagus degradans TaxID=86304 RepID=UPI00247814DE|nr:cupin domain-containing protein [Saccharophagus degradans]WGP00201.1 cupin domain-containing protein [Saccharophagus degradans]
MKNKHRKPIFLQPSEGRPYAMGSISALFKADGEETGGNYSISEWWLEPYSKGPGAHSHNEDDIFFVIDGVVHFLIDDLWKEAQKGSFVLVPGGITHDFENRGDTRAGILNFSVPGSFESNMPKIVSWFEEHPPGNTKNS